MLPTALKDGRHTLRLRVSWDGKRISHCLSNPIIPSEWDDRSGMPKRSQQKAVKELNELTTAVDRLFDKCHLEQRIPSEEEVKMVLGDIHADGDKQNKHNIVTAINEYINESTRTGSWSSGTYKRWKVIKSHLEEWKETMSVEDFNEESMRQYMDFLYGKEMRNTTVAKNVSSVRTFLRWCRKKGYTTNSEWDDYHPRFIGNGDDKEIIYLTQEELRSIMDLKIPKTHYLDQVRDVFLFCCFSGLRYSDVAKLRQSDVHEGYISVVTKKTSDSLRIELNDMSAAILTKYKCDNVNAKALPVTTNQQMNKALKELAKMAKIDEPIRQVYWIKSERKEEVAPKYELISTHCGRKTFVVSALTLEIPSEVIIRWTGHKDLKAMKPYVAIVDKQKRESMERFNKLMTKK
jgi:site-specific recombinase XerD